MNNQKKKIQLGVSFVACFLLLVLIAGIQNNVIKTDAKYKEKNIIVLDAGHGGMDSGCVGINGTLEKDVNLAIVKNLEQLLTFSGFEVILTRDKDTSMHSDGVTGTRNQKVSDMENRLNVIKKYPNSIFFSVHQNQFTESKYFGGQMFYTTKNKDNFRLAQIMQQNFAQIQEGNNREIKLDEKGLYLFKETPQPALLIECGFLSNENDAKNLTSKEYQKKIAFTIYKGLMEYLEEAEEKEGIENNGETEDALRMQ